MDDVLDVDDDDNELSSRMLLFSLICLVPPEAFGRLVDSSHSSFMKGNVIGRGTIVTVAAAAAAGDTGDDDDDDNFCLFSGFFSSSSIEYGFLFRDDVAEVVSGVDVSRTGLPVVVEADGDDLPESQSLNGSLTLLVERSIELSDLVIPA